MRRVCSPRGARVLRCVFEAGTYKDRQLEVVKLDPTPETVARWFGTPAYDELEYRSREVTTKEALEIKSLRTPGGGR